MMRLKVHVDFDVDAIDNQICQAVAQRFADEKVQDVYNKSWYHFRNRTGRLRASIRLVRQQNRVAVGNIIAFYWRFLDNFTRGQGRWVWQAFRTDNPAILRRVASQIRLGRRPL